MEFLLFLTMLVILNTQGRARPAGGDELQTLSNTSEENSNSDMEFKFPTTVTPPLQVTIHGTLNAIDKRFIVILQLAGNENDNCQLMYDFERNTLTTTPALNSDYSSTEYDLFLEKREVVEFYLILTARTRGKNNEEFHMSFEGNGKGLSSPIICAISNFKSLRSIIFKEGVERINSLSFNFTSGDHFQ